MLITEDIPKPNGTRNERIGLVLVKLNKFLTIKESQQIQSVKDLQAAVSESTTAVNKAIADLKALVATHQGTTGAVHGETAETARLGNLKNWRSSLDGDELAPYKDDVYLTSDIAKKLAEALVVVDFSNFMQQGQLPLAYFEGGYYGSLMREFRSRIGYLKTVMGFINTSNTAVRLIRIQGDDDLSSQSFPMKERAKISFLSNQDEYLITAPSDRYGTKAYPVDKYFLSTPIQQGFNPVIQEITDQPYIIRNVGWGSTNQMVSLNTDSSVYTLFSEDFYLGQNHPVEIKTKSGELTQLNYLTIPGSGILGTVSIAGSLQLDHTGINLFLGNAKYNYISADDINIVIDDTTMKNASFISPIDPLVSSKIYPNVPGNLLGLNGVNDYLGVRDIYNQDHDLLVGIAGKGISIPWDNLIEFADGEDKKIQVVDFSDTDPFYNYGSFDWEFEGKTLIGFIDGVITFLNKGNPVKAVFRCGLRITVGESVNVELLEGVTPSKFSGGKFSGGNTVFAYDETDIFHPIFGRGMFLSFGGHATGMTRSTDLAFMIREHKHTNLVNYAKSYWTDPDRGRTAALNYPADRVSVISGSARRLVPIFGDGKITKTLCIAPKPDGNIESSLLVWDSVKPLYDSVDTAGKSLLRGPSKTESVDTYPTFPIALSSVLSKDLGVALNGMVYGNNLPATGAEYYDVTDTLTARRKWGLSATLKTLINTLQQTFMTDVTNLYKTANVTVPANALVGNWLLVMDPTGTAADTISKGYLVLSDGCGYVRFATLAIAPNATNLVFDSQDLANLIIAKSITKNTTPNFDIDQSDSGYEFYDVNISRLSNKTYLQCSRVYGTKRGGCLINATDNQFVNLESPQAELNGYPVSTSYELNYLPIPGGGGFYMSDPSDGVLFNGDKSVKLDIYADEDPATIIDTDGVAKYRYVIPEGASLILGGYQITLDHSLEGLFKADKWPYLYLSMTHEGVVLVLSETFRQPSIYEVLYGRGSYGKVSMITEPYCVIQDKIFSEDPKGSAIPVTIGDVTFGGSSNWKLK